MNAFWQGFDKRAAEVMNDTSFSPPTVTPKQTNFMDTYGIVTRHRGDEHIKNEDNYSTTGVFGY